MELGNSIKYAELILYSQPRECGYISNYSDDFAKTLAQSTQKFKFLSARHKLIQSRYENS